MRLSRSIVVAAMLASPLVSFAADLSPADRISPAAQLERFLPEKLPTLESPAYYGDLEKAKQLLQTGRYKAALYASFKLPDADAADVALLRGEAYWRIGESVLARTTLDAIHDDPRATLLLAQIDLSDAKLDDAIARLKPLRDADPNAVAPRYFLSLAYEAKGDLDAAVAIDRTFAEGDDNVLARFEKEGAVAFESAEDLTRAAACIDRWAAITMQYKTRPELHQEVLAMFVAAYDTVDREYWPAHVAAARYLLAHGNKKEAGNELTAANEANPNSADVNVLLGTMAIDSHNDAGIDEAIRSLRDVDPASPEADLLDVRVKLNRRSFDAALAIASKLVDQRPQDLDALASLAAVYAARGNTDQLNATLAKIDAIAPKDAKSRLLVADMLSTVFYDAAGAMTQLETAVDRAPWWMQPQHALGIALIQEGEEDRARVVLDQAYQVDPYNVVTVNYLRVLDQMTKFREFESARFIFKFAEIDDPIVPLYMAPQMDSTYDDLAKQFRFEPAKKPIVEVFPDAQSFSVRTAGLPGLETYGASLGRVMTVVAPRAGETLGPFNWARVMKHEFTHTLNLMYTHGRVPRWLTEGLAVWEERVPYRFAWVPEAMYERAMKDEMFTPREMAQALTHPKKANDGEIAYMTGFWTVRYIEEHHGWDAVIKLLDGYRDGKGDDDAFTAAVGMNVAQFHEKFAAWSKEQVKSWGYDEATAKKVEAMEKEAEMLTQAAQWDKAAEAWQAIAKLQPTNPLPPRRLAGIYLREAKPAEALPHLLASLPLELQDNRFAKRISRIYDEAGDPSNAMKFANAAVGIDPYDPDVHDLLVSLYTKAGDATKVAQETGVAKLLRERKEQAQTKPATP